MTEEQAETIIEVLMEINNKLDEVITKLDYIDSNTGDISSVVSNTSDIKSAIERLRSSL
ncbi:hypothetical protein PACILC2_21820 [Paenibacillus cisolokensis]|uniref:Uncharacterized protein n=1 Tax=Paenibacillus cisolokensis TaxID=1658519 RepID=A0ABQ4N634_9BACL|nr:hypothetical protein [Paenibacillus cisolokensis]GIQ63614.1 hypothetical protein PACILC2_21820 [Paenibacillus cisolokensis]